MTSVPTRLADRVLDHIAAARLQPQPLFPFHHISSIPGKILREEFNA